MTREIHFATIMIIVGRNQAFAAVITKMYTVTMAALEISFPPAALPNGPITASEQINYRNTSFL